MTAEEEVESEVRAQVKGLCRMEQEWTQGMDGPVGTEGVESRGEELLLGGGVTSLS